jgi:hypothetical protein
MNYDYRPTSSCSFAFYCFILKAKIKVSAFMLKKHNYIDFFIKFTQRVKRC